MPEIGEAHGLLSWVRPGFRRRGAFAAVQAAVEADLPTADVTVFRSCVVEAPIAVAMAAATPAPLRTGSTSALRVQ